jgi:hypothetical protein
VHNGATLPSNEHVFTTPDTLAGKFSFQAHDGLQQSQYRVVTPSNQSPVTGLKLESEADGFDGLPGL